MANSALAMRVLGLTVRADVSDELASVLVSLARRIDERDRELKLTQHRYRQRILHWRNRARGRVRARPARMQVIDGESLTDIAESVARLAEKGSIDLYRLASGQFAVVARDADADAEAELLGTYDAGCDWRQIAEDLL